MDLEERLIYLLAAGIFMEKITEKEVRDLEDQASYLKGEKARALKDKAASALARVRESGTPYRSCQSFRNCAPVFLVGRCRAADKGQ